MASDRDCINLCDIAYLNLSEENNGRSLLEIFCEKTGKNNYRIRDEFRNSKDKNVKQFVQQLRTFPEYYHPTFTNYTLVDTYSSYHTGYGGIACINTNEEVIIANKGSSGLLDYLNDAAMATGNIPPQAESAFKFYKKIREYTKDRGLKNITLTGHSMGGSLATFQMLKFYGDGYLKRVKTFEEYGVLWCVTNVSGPGIISFVDINKLKLIVNYICNYRSWNKIKTAYKNSYDFIANTSMHIGKTIDLTNSHFPRINIDPDHTLPTFKIYALDEAGNIIVGQINQENLDKLNELNPGSAKELNNFSQKAKLHHQQLALEEQNIDEKNLTTIKELLNQYNQQTCTATP